MPPAIHDHVCHQEEIIREFNRRLGDGDVTFATLNIKLDHIVEQSQQIKEQTTKTNGRVTKLEDQNKKPRMNAAAAVAVITCCGIVCTSLITVARDIIESRAHKAHITVEERK